MGGSVALGNALVAQLLDGAPDPTVVVDDRATIVLVNAQVEHVFGYRPDELQGQPIEVLVPERYRAGHPAKRDSFLHHPTERPINVTRELVMLHADGREVPVEISLAPLRTESGLLVSAAVRDVSERKQVLLEAARMREELIGTVSHELRTPLTSIMGYAELLSDLDEQDLSARARKLVSVISRNAERELRLVDDLLTLAFLDGKRLRMVIGQVDLAAVGHRVVADLRPRARQKGLTLSFEGGRAPLVAGDVHRLAQVVENLVVNAIKFTAPGGEVAIRVRADDTGGVIEVSDTGAGVLPEEKERLFDRLYRTPSAVVAQTPGAGLGLSIVQKIVEGHGGRVLVASEVGVGSTFSVHLPAHPTDTDTGGADTEPAAVRSHEVSQ